VRKMKKRIVMIAVMTMILWSLWGDAAYEADSPQFMEIPDGGIPGGPPGIPG
jgi:hypothetical protein